MPFELNWTSIFIGIAIGFVIFNLIQLIIAYGRRKKAREEVKRIEGKIAELKGELEKKKKELEESIRKRTEERK